MNDMVAATAAQPGLDIRVPFHRPTIGNLERAAVAAVLDSGWLSTGAVTETFEKSFGGIVGAANALAVSSATMAALLLFKAMNIGPGDGVVVPAWTFSGPAMMAHQLGAYVSICDVDPVTANMTPDTLAAAIRPSTKIVMPTHFGGRACDMAGIVKVADKVGAFVIDDAAHAFPSYYPDGTMVGGGTTAHASFFSFYATKTVTCGEGGMVTTAHDRIAESIRHGRQHGFDRSGFDRYTSTEKPAWFYDVAHAGWKANMPDLNAAVGVANLGRYRRMNTDRWFIADAYEKALGPLRGSIESPPMDRRSSWHLYPIQIALKGPAGVDVKAAFIKHMLWRGVQCSVHFIPLHHHSFWKGRAFGWRPVNLPNATRLSGRMVSLPIWPGMGHEDVAFVAAAASSTVAALSQEWGL